MDIYASHQEALVAGALLAGLLTALVLNLEWVIIAPHYYGYGNGIAYNNGWTHINGWSEAVLDYILANEALSNNNQE